MKLVAVLVAVVTLASGGFQISPPLRAAVFTSGLQAPVGFVADPTDPSIFYAVEQGGRIRVVRNRVVAEDFLDLRAATVGGGERGLLGMALAPDFAATGRFFVNFTNSNGDTVVARFRRLSAGIADPGSRFDLKWGPERSPVIQQPQSNHNGGHLAFGPDGYLYIGLGDGGGANDQGTTGQPGHNAQNPSTLLGKMLRIDVSVPDSHVAGYVVPPDNPFLDGAPVNARPEIWSFGWRNPWRYSFDPIALGGTGALVIADVGQNHWEEVDYEPRGAGGRNYGWRNREGAQANPNSGTQSPGPAFQPLIDPIHQYSHSDGSSISGGYVYRGVSLGAAYRGRYFFADYIRQRLWSIGLNIGPGGEASPAGLIEHTAELGGGSQLGSVSAFGIDQSGELYIVSHTRGIVFRLFGELTPPAGLRIIR
jgi:glucose/arabinose dehydrogenase